MGKNINKINPILLIVGAALIMFFSYLLLIFHPMAQCKTALKKKSPNTTSENLVLVCQEMLKNR